MIVPSEDVAQTRSAKRGFGGAVAVAAVGAAACGVCCALPFALPAVVLAGAGGAMAWLNEARGVFAIVGVPLVVLAWVWVGQNSARTGRRPARSTLVAMVTASIVAVAGVGLQLAALC